MQFWQKTYIWELPLTLLFRRRVHWRDFIFRQIAGEGLEIEAGIDADEENHPGENGDDNKEGNPHSMKEKPTCADQNDRR
jgi:hypothetical protein